MFSISRLNFVWICALLIWPLHPGAAAGQAEKLHVGYSIYTGAVLLPPETSVAKKLGLNFLLDLSSVRIDFQTSIIAAARETVAG